MTTKELSKQALEAMKKAYAPYSGFQVGAAVLASSGKVYTGANIENASYGATICAERVAIFKAVNAGERKLKAIALAGGMKGRVTDFCAPCGICRQVMREFADPKSFKIHLVKTPSSVKTFTLEKLLPESFGPDNLSK